jgi:hypothetical protein
MIYVEEAELSRYVFVYFRHLWSAAERAADRALLVEQKTRNREETRYAKVLRQHLGSTDPAVLELVKLGPAAFQSHVVARLLRECSAQLVLNRCPKCQALARTPRAKQCPRCFFSWHETA